MSARETRRVGVYVPRYLPGSETFIHRQLRYLDRYSATVLARDVMPDHGFPLPGVDFVERPMVAKLAERVLSAGARRPGWQPRPVETPFLAHAVKRAGLDVVHAHFGDRAMRCIGAVRSTKVAFVVTFHGYDATKFLKQTTFNERYPGLADVTTTIVAVSDFIKSQLIDAGAPADKIVRHYIGVPIPKERAGPSSATLLQVSRFVEKKGIVTTLEAFAEASTRVPEVKLVLVGDGPMRGQAEEFVRVNGLTSRVHFAGDVSYDGVLEHLRDAGVFIHPSQTSAEGDQEGLPTAILEAMANGVPVLATHHAGIPEAVRDGAGHLVEERDASGLATHIVDLFSDAGRRIEMGQAARAVAEADFDVKANTRLLEDIYESSRSR